jgi:DNA-binding protein HU-beta
MAKAKRVTKKTTKKAPAKKKAAATTKPAAKRSRVKYPEKYTTASIVSHLAEANRMPKKAMKEIVEGFYDVVRTGVMRGQKVPLGKIGKLYFRVRPAQKTRKGRNPRTGEEITIPAKRATKVPKFSFNRGFKEDVLKARVPKS